MKSSLIIFIVSVFFFYGCSASRNLKNPVLESTYWKLTELMGKPVTNPPVNQKEIFIRLNKEQNRVSGNGGCNSFGGNFELKEGNRISFSKMMSTMMACPEMSPEQELFRVLETADSYIINGNELQLVRARMAPLARFVAAKQP